MSNDVLITPASRKIEFKDSSGNVDAVIQTDSSGNLSITNTGGDLSLGDTSSDVFIGDGTNNIDLVFEQNGEIRGTSGVTVTLGASGATTNLAGTVQLGGTTITSTGAELNILDGVTATTAELNILDGVTATATEINKLDGVTATTAELNKLDGVTATTAELNYTDGVTSNIQTQLNSKLGTSTSFSGDVSGAYNNIQIGSNKVGITELCVTDGSNGQVLTTNGSGTLSFTTVSGGGGGASAINDLTDGYCAGNSIGLGTNALANESNNQFYPNIAIGTQAGCSITSGCHNVVIGRCAGDSITEGDSNVLIGNCVAHKLVCACDNVVLGDKAMGSTTGNAQNSTDNIAIGTCALYQSCTGGCSIAMGYKALLQQNKSSFDIAIGHCAMYKYGGISQDYTTLGRIGSVVIGACAGACFWTYPNVIVGAFAGQEGNGIANSVILGQRAAECSGSGFCGIVLGFNAARCSYIQENIVIGGSAHCVATSGNSNIAMGTFTARSITTGSRNVFIGKQAALDMTIGGCNVALGYSALSNAVESCFSVVVGHNAGNKICATGGCNTILIGSCSGFDALCCVTTANNIAIFGNNVTDCIIQKVATTVPSDCRDKTDIGDMGLGLDFINEICPISYKFDDRGWYKNGAVPDGSKKDAKCRVGFIAQNVVTAEQCYNPNGPLLIANNDREDRYTITETNLIPALVKAIQELSAKVDELENA
jgi:hypothetical protein